MIRQDIKELFKDGLARHVAWEPKDHHAGHIMEKQLHVMLDWIGDIRGTRVLDIGIASGRFVYAFAQSGADTHGAEISRVILHEVTEQMAELALPVKLTQCDAENLPFAEESFEAINCQQVLLHLPHKEVALREMSRVLKPGGRLVIDLTNRKGLFAVYEHLFKFRFLYRLKDVLKRRPRRSIVYTDTRTANEFRDLLEGAGFEIRKLEGFGFLPAMGWICPLRLSRLLTPRLDRMFGRILPGGASFIMAQAIKPPLSDAS